MPTPSQPQSSLVGGSQTSQQEARNSVPTPASGMPSPHLLLRMDTRCFGSSKVTGHTGQRPET